MSIYAKVEVTSTGGAPITSGNAGTLFLTFAIGETKTAIVRLNEASGRAFEFTQDTNRLFITNLDRASIFVESGGTLESDIAIGSKAEIVFGLS